jgi:hypothetical protein
MIYKLGYVFFAFTLLTISHCIFGQTAILKGFSKNHYAKVHLIDKEKNESVITIFNNSDNKIILEIKSESYVMDTQLEDLKSNSSQEIVLYQDFNFDNYEDFAIQTDYSSKGPSYSIFLFKDGKYILDNVFTNIIQNSQGNFDLDKNTKTISTRGNGGCCWHSYSKFVVTNGIPKLMSETIEELDFSIETVTETIWKNGKYNKSVVKTINLENEGIKEIMSFNLKNSKKRVVLYNINDRTLNYALIKSDNTIEFYFPIEVEYKKPDFGINTSSTLSELTFKNKGVKYKIYQNKTKQGVVEIGILVDSNGKIFNLQGEISTLKGNLKWSDIIELDNVFTEK